MRKRVVKLTVALLFVFTVSTSVFSLGLGFSASFLSSRQTYTDNNTGLTSPERDQDLAGINFILDTAVAKNKLFNYRLTVGLEFSTDSNQDFMVGYNLFNTFGFALVRNSRVRLWVGPELGFYLYAKDDYADDYYTLLGGGVSLGAVAGLNIHMGSVFTISFTAGVRQRFGFEISDDLNPADRDYEVESTEKFATIGCVFRIRDVFRRSSYRDRYRRRNYRRRRDRDDDDDDDHDDMD